MKSPLQLQAEVRDWTRRYERLREQVLATDHCISADITGLTILISRGMAAWMRSWQEPVRCCQVMSTTEALPMSLSSQSWQEEATRLLVNMALCHLGPDTCNG